jgi:hypothetical protein
MSAHNSLGILFLVAVIWHAALNRRALIKYLRGTRFRVSGGSREAACAASLVLAVLFVALAHLYEM